ncbi:MAG: hypothetical protein NTX50_31835 [Candidatus Sumerlaeota bacterium]|nr:hypothetical protein [Candidatus Sumerlaeota bacterium]
MSAASNLQRVCRILHMQGLFFLATGIGIALCVGTSAAAEWKSGGGKLLGGERSVVHNGIYTMGGYIDNFQRNTDADGDGYAEAFSLEVHMNAMAEAGLPIPVNILARCKETGQFWRTGNTFSITPDTLNTSTFWINLDQTDFAGKLRRNMELHFSVEMWDETYAHQLAAIPEAFSLVPVKVDVVSPSDLRNLNSTSASDDKDDKKYQTKGFTVGYKTGNDVDDNGFPETYAFSVGVSAFGDQLVRNTVLPAVYCITTGQSFVSPVTLTVADGKITSTTMQFTEADFKGRIKGPTTLKFGTALLSTDASRTVLANDDEVFDLIPIKVDFVPPSNANMSAASTLGISGAGGRSRAWIDYEDPAMDEDGSDNYAPEIADDSKVMHGRHRR